MAKDDNRQIVRMSFREFNELIALSFIFFGSMIGLFFYEGWHVPEFWQPFVLVGIYVFVLYFAMVIKWKILCIKIKNQ